MHVTPKIALSFLLTFLPIIISNAQDYYHVDKKVESYPHFHSIDNLAIRIQNDFNSDIERVRAGFFWVASNIFYGQTMDEFFKTKESIVFFSEKSKKKAIEKIEYKRTVRAFKNRMGLCIDYSKILKRLFDAFEIESHIIRGVVKEHIKKLNGETVYKNHAWNIVKLENKWILMDPTWASGYYDDVRNVQVQEFNDHYFDMDPKNSIKDHFPLETKWQMLQKPISLNDFFSAPIFLPDYFKNDIELSHEMSGILNLTENNELVFSFNKFPIKNNLNYSLDLADKTGRIRSMFLRESETSTFVSKLRIKKILNSGNQLTLYIDKRPIIKFKIDR